ncbi:RNA polymerase sigma factor, partial [Geobacillus sp. MMMUD3]|nr:RNA polymerase sigma factor [Geobacillus sp. MMMUD3]
LNCDEPLIPFEPSGSENASDGVVTPEIPRTIPHNQSSVVLLKDEDDEPLEQLSWLPETDDLVKVYLNQIAQYSLLSAEQEVECAMRIEAGLFAKYLHDLGKYSTRRERHDLEGVVADGDAAFDQMVCANLRLVVSVAKRYSGRKMAFLD